MPARTARTVTTGSLNRLNMTTAFQALILAASAFAALHVQTAHAETAAQRQTLAALKLSKPQPCNAPVTHASLERELANLEAAGFNPAGNDNDYPQNLERAERIVAAHTPPCTMG
ncbi:DUF4148 domain-containing protein [Cupriavidus plantarum]|uniref:Uncharacterized protein DUF4148 n=1 Tax=Cupriavidus plantarum TaxID=942865 RepID=A0A316EYA9_9BURK|nr:DUF4148 domain-containing protein [Cupriavidus plantarum]PWK37707.1 uncharacterized protein DUF4148 [Cupriavidus plantarum]